MSNKPVLLSPKIGILSLLHNTTLQDLVIPEDIKEKLADHGIQRLDKLFFDLKSYKVNPQMCFLGLGEQEVLIVERQLRLFMDQHNTANKCATTLEQSGNSSVGNIGNSGNLISFPPKTILNSFEQEKPTKPAFLRQRALWRDGRSEFDELEIRLREQLSRVELVGEVPITPELCTEIGAKFSLLLKGIVSEQAAKLIEADFPASLTVFLVGQGIYGYKGGDYWSSVNDIVGVDLPNLTVIMGQIFERTLRRLHLPIFSQLQQQSMRYVSLILAHGGIPVYCLDDYFTHIVMPTVDKQYGGLDDEELLAEILQRSSSQYGTDRPVLYFLQYGGRTATDFFRRSRQLIQDWIQTTAITSPEEAGLPAYVIEFFQKWISKGPLLAIGGRMVRPSLLLDPWGMGIYIKLPTQPVKTLDVADAEWLIESGDSPENVPVRVQHKGGKVETEEISFRLDTINPNYKVTFSIGDNSWTWVIPGYDASKQPMIFDPQNGSVLRRIPGKECWIVYPEHNELEITSGQGNLLEELPSLPGVWRKTKVECWDFSDAKEVAIKHNGQIFWKELIHREGMSTKPELRHGNSFKIDTSGQPPIYLGKPPVLAIPKTVFDECVGDRTRWKLKIKSIGRTSPELDLTVPIADIPNHSLAFLESWVEIDLSSPGLLGLEPFGDFSITVRGPLGQDAYFTNRFLPDVRLYGADKLYIPSRDEGASVIQLAASIDKSYRIELEDSASSVKIRASSPGLYQIIVPPDKIDVNLLVCKDQDNQVIQVPLSFAVRRLRWRVVTSLALADNWSDHLVTIPNAVFFQQKDPILLIELPAKDGEEPSLTLKLFNMQKDEVQTLVVNRRGKYAGRFWRFDLKTAADTIKRTASPIMRFMLEINGLEDESTGEPLPVMSLTQDIQIRNIKAQAMKSKKGFMLMLSWEEKISLQCRYIYLWPLWRPWDQIVTLPIPDENRSNLLIDLPDSHLIPGDYRLGFAIVDPWSAPDPSLEPPSKGTIETAELSLISPEERLSQLVQLQNNSQEFRCMLEKAHICLATGRVHEFNKALSWLCRRPQQAQQRELLACVRLIKESPDCQVKQDFAWEIMQPQIIRRLLNYLAEDVISIEEFLDIITTGILARQWPAESCELLASFNHSQIRQKAIQVLIDQDLDRAVRLILRLLDRSFLLMEDAVEFLAPDKDRCIRLLDEYFSTNSNTPTLKELLSKYVFGNSPIIKPGRWIQTNVGWGRIDRIEDPRTHISLDEFIQGRDKFRLHVSLHIQFAPEKDGEKAIIDMQSGRIIFPRARRMYTCCHCEKFSSQYLDILKSHLILEHSNVQFMPADSNNEVELKFLEFGDNPHAEKLQDD